MTSLELLAHVLKGKRLAPRLEQIPDDALFGVWMPPNVSADRLRAEARVEFDNFWSEFTRDKRYAQPRLLGEQPSVNPTTGAYEFRFARLRKR